MARIILILMLLVACVGAVSATEQRFNTTNDGYATHQVTLGAPWLTLRSGAGTAITNNAATTLVMGDLLANATLTNNYTNNKRGLITFNTTMNPSIPITSAKVSIWGYQKGKTVGAFNYTIINATPADQKVFAAGDYAKTGFVRMSNDIPYASLTLTAWNNFTLNVDGINEINQTGNTTFMFASDVDADNGAVTWNASGNSFFYMLSKAYSGGNNAPFITINYDPISPTPTKYYAYGDSITRATGGGSLNATGNDVYILQMRDRYNASALADHNIDGGSKTSDWGLANIATHPGSAYNVTNQYIMFGANDRALGETGLTTAQNLESMYNILLTNGTTPKIMMPTVATVTGTEWTRLVNQQDNITIIQNYLTSKSIPYIKAYDAIDSVPGNGVPDASNTSLLFDYIHPNKEGHSILADYVWSHAPSTGALEVSFTTDRFITLIPQAVNFNSTSTGTPTTLNWSWGDGQWSNGTGDDPAASHQYTRMGYFRPYLIASNAAGSGTSDPQWVMAWGFAGLW